MATYSGIDVERVREIRDDIITVSRENKLKPEFYKELSPAMQREIKRLIGNYNQVIKLGLELVKETKEYSKTTFVFNEEDASEYSALMAIIGE